MEDWAGVYKFARLAVLALVLGGIALYLFTGSQAKKRRLEEPAKRMLEDDDR